MRTWNRRKSENTAGGSIHSLTIWGNTLVPSKMKYVHILRRRFCFQAHTLRNARIPAAGEMYESIVASPLTLASRTATREDRLARLCLHNGTESEKKKSNIYMLHHKFNVDRKAIQRMQFTQDSKTCKTKQYIVWKYKYIWGKNI